jgi:hypothetical protein
VVVSNGTSRTTVWVEDAVPAGAWMAAERGDHWNWVSNNPAPYSGTHAHQSTLAPGIHNHYFSEASARLPVGFGDTLFTYVYLNPANPPGVRKKSSVQGELHLRDACVIGRLRHHSCRFA